MRIYVSGLVVLFSIISASFAGLDQHSRFDDVIAIYKFANTNDSGPKGHNLTLEDGAILTDEGKFGKGLQVSEEGAAYSLRNNDGFLSSFDFSLINKLSIVAWVKTSNQSGEFCIVMAQRDEEEEWSSASLCVENNTVDGLFFEPDDGLDFTDETQLIEAEVPEINNGRWHHIGFTIAEDFYRIFVDGEVKISEEAEGSISVLGFSQDKILLNIGQLGDTALGSNVYVDDVGLFETGFSIYEMKGLYEEGLDSFLEAMPVDPQGKVATTWGKIKARR